MIPTVDYGPRRLNDSARPRWLRSVYGAEAPSASGHCGRLAVRSAISLKATRTLCPPRQGRPLIAADDAGNGSAICAVLPQTDATRPTTRNGCQLTWRLGPHLMKVRHGAHRNIPTGMPGRRTCSFLVRVLARHVHNLSFDENTTRAKREETICKLWRGASARMLFNQWW